MPYANPPANGQRGALSPHHQVGSWYPVMLVELVPSVAAGDNLVERLVGIVGIGHRDLDIISVGHGVSPLAWVKAKELPTTQPWTRPEFRATISAQDEARPTPMLAK
jgi:hypothetical protein